MATIVDFSLQPCTGPKETESYGHAEQHNTLKRVGSEVDKLEGGE
jgi:hypothetical protein